MRNSLQNYLKNALQQTATGSITGTVTDPNGAVIAGAEVTLINDATNNRRTPATNGHGAFTIAALRPGNYTITIEATGFKRFVFTRIRIDAGKSSHFEVGSMTETVTVTGSSESPQTQIGNAAPWYQLSHSR